MQRPESSEKEFFDNYDKNTFNKVSEEFIALEEKQQTIKEKKTVLPLTTEHFTAESTSNDKKDPHFLAMGQEIINATLNYSNEIHNYIANYGGILMPLHTTVDSSNEVVARILIGAAIVAATKRFKYLKADKLDFLSIFISCIRFVLAIYYPIFYLAGIAFEELIWNYFPKKNKLLVDPLEASAQPVAPLEAPAAPLEAPAQPAAPLEAPAQPVAPLEVPAQPVASV